MSHDDGALGGSTSARYGSVLSEMGRSIIVMVLELRISLSQPGRVLCTHSLCSHVLCSALFTSRVCALHLLSSSVLLLCNHCAAVLCTVHIQGLCSALTELLCAAALHSLCCCALHPLAVFLQSAHLGAMICTH
ncbi:hypothetical protein GDO81_024241 [Engystomops pustulosus]|uniref:Uncharacterized protein n=1 Tax=Engystomops pustulosus TaxID=76066 RepID=A0AAV6ZMZ5_ENGPU|nr:hypothetical protein GDO81_024241 [Engystomops pustulosus]